MTLQEHINPSKLPRHIAIIMDGNGRWAAQRGRQRIFGHRNGIESVRQAVEAAGELGVEYLTLYSFSTENWNRPKAEINGLMYLLGKAITNETQKLHQNNVRLQVIGNINDLPPKLQKQLRQSINILAANTGLTLVLALSYSGRWEISQAMKQIGQEVQKGTIDPKNIDSALIERFLHTSTIPDPELLIRTSGEKRISNFLLWQLAYTEFHFTPVLWPDFRKEHFHKAIIDFQKRERRFGKVLIQDSSASARADAELSKK